LQTEEINLLQLTIYYGGKSHNIKSEYTKDKLQRAN